MAFIKIKNCLACGSKKLRKILDLNKQPLANSYLDDKSLNRKEKKFRLVIGFNPKNYLVSILNTVPKEKMFNEKYPYKSSESKTMKQSFKLLSQKIKKRFKPNLVLEIGDCQEQGDPAL